ncbi:MAG: hypothetical protein ACLFM0_00995, partial [Spirochaetales bacterium]
SDESDDVVFDDFDASFPDDQGDNGEPAAEQLPESEGSDDEIPEELIVTLDSEESNDTRAQDELPTEDSSGSLVSDEEPYQSNGPDEMFGASEEQVDALASMDIDTELADIEELEDEPRSPSEQNPERVDTDAADDADIESVEQSAARPAETPTETPTDDELPENLREEIKSVLSYMDQLLESLPEEKIREFANSEHFEVYKRLFEELGLEP